MIAYKKDKKFIYISDNNLKDTVHYVSTGNWSEYVKLRKNVPTICRIFDTIGDTYKGAEGEPVSSVYVNYTKQRIKNKRSHTQLTFQF